MQIRHQALYPNHLTRWQALRRRIGLSIFRCLPFIVRNHEQVDPALVREVERYCEEGRAVIFTATHFGQREIVDFALTCRRFHALFRKRADCPAAVHQSSQWFVRLLARLIRVNFWPVFIEDTVKALQEGKFKWPAGQTPTRHELVELNEAYFAGARENLSLGGALFVAIKPGRRPSLEFTNDRSLHRLLMSRDANGNWVDNPNVVLVLVGVSLYNKNPTPPPDWNNGAERNGESIQRPEDLAIYQKFRGPNVGVNYDLRMNVFLTYAERQALYARTGMTIDHLATALLANQVDYRYVNIPRDIIDNAWNAYLQVKASGGTP